MHLFRRLRARPRFAADRFISGPLGLELTTTLTLLAVGTLSFVLLGDLILANPSPRIDSWAFDVADRLQTSMLVDVAKVVTALGSFPAIAVAAAATAVWAIVRNRPIDAVALAAGVLATWIAVHAGKNVRRANDDTRFALVDGVVRFEFKDKDRRKVSVYPDTEAAAS